MVQPDNRRHEQFDYRTVICLISRQKRTQKDTEKYGTKCNFVKFSKIRSGKVLNSQFFVILGKQEIRMEMF